MNTDHLMQMTPNEQIKELLSSIGTIPANIIFGQQPRLQTSFCKWIPSTFLGTDGIFLGAKGYMTASGLQVTFPGFHLDDLPPSKLGNSFLVMLDNKLPLYEVVLHMHCKISTGSENIANMAVVLENELESKEFCRAIIVFIWKVEEDCIFAHYGAPIQFRNFSGKLPDKEHIQTGWNMHVKKWVIG